MGRDHQPKHRQRARDLARRAAVRGPNPRLLIVCEGGKTEPGYLDEIRRDLRLSSLHVCIQPGRSGTDPRSVVRYAERLVRHGAAEHGIHAGAFEEVFAVFDRDTHTTYHQALSEAAALDRQLQNGEGEAVRFRAIASVPCFELWLLLHFEEVTIRMTPKEVVGCLRSHLPGYEKAGRGLWAATRGNLKAAMHRAGMLAAVNDAHDGTAPCTSMDELLAKLMALQTSP